MPYEIIFSPIATRQLDQFTARNRTITLTNIGTQLRHSPSVETRNRKRLRPNRLAPWELRVGDIRVYYDIREDPERVVLIVAAGIKVGNRVMIGGEEYEP